MILYSFNIKNMKVRISTTIPKDILKKFDGICKELGYKNRSNAVSAAIYEFIVANKWAKQQGNIAGAILITYLHKKNINDILTDIQHEYNDVINAAMHIHLSKEQCLEIIAINGNAKKIRQLYKKLQGVKGILSTKIVTAA